MNTEDGILRAISAIETIAPRAWSLLVEEQRSRAIAELFECGIAFAGSVAVAFAVRKLLAPQEDIDDQPRSVAKWVLMLVCFVFACVAVSSTIDNIIVLSNPAPFAARALIDGARR